MSRPRTDAEAGRDLQQDTPTLDDLRRAHDWRHEERAEGRYVVDVCAQCGHEESGGSAGRSPDCAVREIPSAANGDGEASRATPRDRRRAARLDARHAKRRTVTDGCLNTAIVSYLYPIGC